MTNDPTTRTIRRTSNDDPTNDPATTPTTPPRTTTVPFAERQRQLRALVQDDPDLDHVDSWTGIDN